MLMKFLLAVGGHSFGRSKQKTMNIIVAVEKSAKWV
jgi:hypothetical protein